MISLSASEYIQSLEASIRREVYESKKNEIKKALEEAYDKVIEKKKEAMVKLVEKNNKSNTNINEIEKCFKMVPKSQFVSSLIKDIENDNVEKRGSTVMTVDISEIKEILGQNKFLDVVRFILIFFGQLWISIPLYLLTSGKGVTGMINKSKRKVNNQYFEVRWNGLTRGAILAKLTNGLFFDNLEMNIAPKFKIKD